MQKPASDGADRLRTVRPGLAFVLAVVVSACADSPTDIVSPTPETPTAAFQGRIAHGVFLGDVESESHRIRSSIENFSGLAGSRPAMVKTFHRLDDDFGPAGWAGRTLREVDAAGAVSLVALDLRWSDTPPEKLLAAIAEGHADTAIRTLARQLAAFGAPVLIEPGWEMNGDWAYPWQGVHNGGDGAPAVFAAAWRRLVDVVRSEGAVNALWVFSPSVGNPVAGRGAGNSHWNWYGYYYPGDAWVDYLGLHGFNAPSIWHTPFLTFHELFDSLSSDRMLSDMTARFPGKGIIISEFASEEGAPGAKAEWIRNAYSIMDAHPAITAAIWFHMDKETDWRVNSSSSSLDAFRLATARPAGSS
ncbi:hypothetical protein BH23GEM9_BH23GEM9_00310 [soil metagenome]